MRSQTFWWCHLSRVLIVNMKKYVWPNETLQHFGNISIISFWSPKPSSSPWQKSCLILQYAMIQIIITSVITRKLMWICADHDNVSNKYLPAEPSLPCGKKAHTILLNWKLTICLFPHDSFVLEYAGSSNQRDFFFQGSLVLRIHPIKSVEYAWLQKLFQQELTFFFNALLFFSACLFLVYLWRVDDGTVPEAILRLLAKPCFRLFTLYFW